jgi:hypothetical protein
MDYSYCGQEPLRTRSPTQESHLSFESSHVEDSKVHDHLQRSSIDTTSSHSDGDDLSSFMDRDGRDKIGAHHVVYVEGGSNMMGNIFHRFLVKWESGGAGSFEKQDDVVETEGGGGVTAIQTYRIQMNMD